MSVMDSFALCGAPPDEQRRRTRVSALTSASVAMVCPPSCILLHSTPLHSISRVLILRAHTFNWPVTKRNLGESEGGKE